MFVAGIVNNGAVKVPATVKLPGTRTVSAARPSTTELLSFTKAPDPKAVAKFKLPAPTFAPEPMIVFDVPVVLETAAFAPTNELLSPVVAVPEPTKTLLIPLVAKTLVPPI